VANKSKQLVISLAMLAGATAVSALLYFTRPPSQIAEPEQVAVTVDVAVVVRETLRIPVQAQGTVTPLQATDLRAEVNGRIIEVADGFNVGNFVARDEVLLRIDPRDYQSALLRAEAALKSAESILAQEKGRAEVASREWSKLPKGAQRSEEAKNLYLRKPQLALAEAELLSALAGVDTARNNLDRTVIRAPYDALIEQKHSELGQFVTAGTALVDLFSVESAEVRLPIPQSKLDYLELPGLHGYQAGAQIDLYTDVGGQIKHWTAQLDRTEGVLDERSRVLYTVARIDDPYSIANPGSEPLRVGSFVNANIQGRELKNIVVLPRRALRAGSYVWVVDDAMHLRNRKVTTLRTGGDKAYISAGLDDGDLVSLTNLDNSFAGAVVEIVSRTPSNLLDESALPAARDEPELSKAAGNEPEPTGPAEG
jgi:RND family efflux transporter MFP subunit